LFLDTLITEPYASTAIDMAKKLNVDYSDTENLLKEIESKKQLKK